jgi:hypothetical protein
MKSGVRREMKRSVQGKAGSSSGHHFKLQIIDFAAFYYKSQKLPTFLPTLRSLKMTLESLKADRAIRESALMLMKLDEATGLRKMTLRSGPRSTDDNTVEAIR